MRDAIIKAHMRGLAVHWLRFYWQRRHEDGVRAQRRRQIRAELQRLRRMGTLPRIEVVTCGGEVLGPTAAENRRVA